MLRFYILLLVFASTMSAYGQVIKMYVAANGKDSNPGNFEKPFKTLKKALSVSENFSGKQVSIQMRNGTYYLPETVIIKNTEKRPEKLEIRAYSKEKVVISAGRKINTDWQLFKNGIYRTAISPGISFERLYVDGLLQTLARYPNADTSAGIFSGTAEDAVYYVRVLSWGNPSGGYLHTLDEHKKGSLHYRITGVDDTDNVELDGGLQFNKPVYPDKSVRFVENIFVELDAPGEWFFDRASHFLYFYPGRKTDLSKAIVVVANLKNSIVLQGSATNPVRNVSFVNLHFRHTERTFMESKEPVSGSEWNVYKDGAVLFNGTENCRIENCSFSGLGGNAIMLSGYNKNDTVKHCLVDHVGASAISLIGNVNTKNEVSGEISIYNNTFRHTGEIEKQGSAIHISNAKRVLIQNNKISHIPGKALKFDSSSLKEIKSLGNTVYDEFRELKPH